MGYLMRPLGYGLGVSTEGLNSTEVLNTTVGPGSSWTFTPWLDAALTVSGIPSDQASRVLNAVRSVLQSVGSEVDRVVWGGGEGLESIRGKVYVKWRPDKPYNAVDYANIARRLFMRAAEAFPAGARIVMNRYRIDNAVSSDLYAYPSPGREIPPSAPEAARATTVEDLPPPVREPETGVTPESAFSTDAKTAVVVGAVGGGLLVVGLGTWWLMRRRMRPNRRRRRR